MGDSSLEIEKKFWKKWGQVYPEEARSEQGKHAVFLSAEQDHDGHNSELGYCWWKSGEGRNYLFHRKDCPIEPGIYIVDVHEFAYTGPDEEDKFNTWRTTKSAN